MHAVAAAWLCRAGRARGFDTFFEQQRRGCNQMLRVGQSMNAGLATVAVVWAAARLSSCTVLDATGAFTQQ